MIDFHCHITTDGSHLPEQEGDYYQTLKPLQQSGEWMNIVWQETIEAIAETVRAPRLLRGYKQVLPVIYSEMSRRMINTTGKRLMMEMAHHHVRQAAVVAIDPFVPTPEVVEICASTKDILVPFGSVDPWADDWKEQLERHLALPIRGFKFHFALQRLPLGHPRMHEIVAGIAEKRPELPLYMHTGEFPIYKPVDEDWSKTIGPLLSEFSNMRFVCGHCGWNRPAAALRAAMRHSNLWLETSWQPPRVIHRLAAALGPKRLLMGSDFPLFSMRRAIRNCKVALSPEDFELVSERNARALLYETQSM